MKRFRDYSKWSIERLEEKAAHTRSVIERLRAGGHPHRGNVALLAELEKHIATKRSPT